MQTTSMRNAANASARAFLKGAPVKAKKAAVQSRGARKIAVARVSRGYGIDWVPSLKKGDTPPGIGAMRVFARSDCRFLLMNSNEQEHGTRDGSAAAIQGGFYKG